MKKYIAPAIRCKEVNMDQFLMSSVVGTSVSTSPSDGNYPVLGKETSIWDSPLGAPSSSFESLWDENGWSL